jgi:hypothetical protein
MCEVFVLNCPTEKYKSRLHKYDNRYNIFEGTTPDEITDEEIKQYSFYWNANPDYRRAVISCRKTHLKMLDHIIENNLRNVVVLEDDTIIDDFDKLKNLENFHSFCYLGGKLGWKIKSKDGKNDMKDFKNRRHKEITENLKKGINEIGIENCWRISQTCGYFIPDKKEAMRIKILVEDYIPNNFFRKKAIDTEFILLQKEKKIKWMFYPAIAVLHLEDAKKGFTGSNYQIGQQKFYL